MPKPTATPPLDDMMALQVFADDVSGFWFNAGCVHITLAASRADHRTKECEVFSAPVLRLTLPVSIAQALALNLCGFLDQCAQARPPAAAVERAH